MLPNFKYLICGLVLGLLLFAAAGAGAVLPDSHTRVGEMPEIGRPMMLRAIAEEPATAQFHMMAVVRRARELERLRLLALFESVSERTEPGLPTTAILVHPVPGSVLVEDVKAQVSQRTGAAEIMPETALGSVQVPRPEIGSDVGPREVDRAQPAVLPPSADAALNTPAPVAKTPSRPTVGIRVIHKRAPHRRHRVVQAPYASFGQRLFLRLHFEFPKAARGLNGMCLIAPKVLLVADSFAGLIWRVDLDADGGRPQAREWLAHVSMGYMKSDGELRNEIAEQVACSWKAVQRKDCSSVRATGLPAEDFDAVDGYSPVSDLS